MHYTNRGLFLNSVNRIQWQSLSVSVSIMNNCNETLISAELPGTCVEANKTRLKGYRAFFSSVFITESFASIYVNICMPMHNSEGVCYCK